MTDKVFETYCAIMRNVANTNFYLNPKTGLLDLSSTDWLINFKLVERHPHLFRRPDLVMSGPTDTIDNQVIFAESYLFEHSYTLEHAADVVSRTGINAMMSFADAAVAAIGLEYESLALDLSKERKLLCHYLPITVCTMVDVSFQPKVGFKCRYGAIQR